MTSTPDADADAQVREVAALFRAATAAGAHERGYLDALAGSDD